MADSSYGIWKATTNLVTNGGFETNTTGWTNVGGSTVLTRQTTEKKFGTTGLQVDVTGAASTGARYPISLTSGLTYTASAWFKATAGTALRMIFAGTTLNFNASGSWERKTITVTPGTTGTFNLDLFVGSIFAVTYYVDGVQVEESAYATPYVETNGAAATRNDALVQISAQLLNTTQGWVAVRFRQDVSQSGADFYLFGSYADSSNVLQLAMSADITNRSLGIWRGAHIGGNSISLTPSDWTGLGNKTGIGKWTATQIGVSLNGGAFTTTGNTNAPSKPSLAEIGSAGDGNSRLDGEILWIVFGLGTLADSDAATLHALGDIGPIDLAPLVDDFNRASLGSNWVAAWGDGNAAVIDASTTYCGAGAGVYSGAYYAPVGSIEDAEYVFKLDTAPTGSDTATMLYRTNNPGTFNPPTSDWEGFFLQVAAGAWSAGVRDTGVVTTLASGSVTHAAGDQWRVINHGTHHGIYRKPVAGSWTFMGAFTNTRFTKGYVGFEFFGNTAKIDDFKAGRMNFDTIPGYPIMYWDAGAETYIVVEEYKVGAGAAVYTDSATVRLSLTPSDTQVFEGVDSATARLSFTPSASDVGVFVDSGTESFVFTPSGTEQRISTDSDTARLSFTPSASDTAQYVDAATEVLALTPSGAEQRVVTDTNTVSLLFTPSATETKETTDAATTTLSLTPSGTETRESTDAATASLTFTPSAADTAQFVDSTTALLTTLPSGSDVLVAADAATGILVFTPSSSDTLQATESATARLSLTPSSTDALAGVDSATQYLALTPSVIEQRESTDSDTAQLRFTPSGTDDLIPPAITYTDSATVLLALSPSTVSEFTEHADTNTVRLSLTPSATETAQYVDSNTAQLIFTPSGVDQKEGVGVDSETAVIFLQPSATDTAQFVEAGLCYLTFTPSASEATVFVESNTVRLSLTPSSGVEYVEHTDSNTAAIRFTPNGSDTAQYVEGGTASLALTPSGEESSATYSDNAVATLRYSPSAIEWSEYADTATVPLALVPSFTSEISTTDVGELYLALVPSATTELQFDDTGTVVIRITAPLAPRYHLTSVAFLRWASRTSHKVWTSVAYVPQLAIATVQHTSKAFKEYAKNEH